MRLGKTGIIAGVCLLAGVMAAKAAEPIKIRIAWMAAPTNLAPILFAKPGIAKHLGKSYTVEPIRFNGSPQMITAMGAGELDIALFSYSSFALAVENARMKDLRVIADDFQGNVPGRFQEGYLVLKDSPIKSIEDLKGKVLATNGAGGAIDIALRTAMRRHNMRDKRDFTIIEAPLPSMKALLIEKKVDLVPRSIPFAHDPELKNASRVLFTQGEYVGITQTLLWAAKSEFIQKNRAALTDFMEDVIRARSFYLDPANREEAIALVIDFTKQPRSYFDSWVFTEEDAFRDPQARPNAKALQSNIDTQYESGFLKNRIDVAPYIDVSLIDAAVARPK
ncbi:MULTISPECIES: ABC transporter substrate-binding protein [unclassified Beijerinckia]|uniref:ABC transporter substrate-binding protein n=1 Tax=unclassified Beijerinckia TaxID=2638183 RepID=UPI0008989FEA|nr:MULTISPECIES: ABC transporter substrate-binding protein [unclassified Beijerinckia]MDH7799215.1 sulfonate transport system substrate-binding protein [Beijerinckia sp. GAS462]SED91739.1 NitT/TauT family transport system substrate-binding protein [Beijerinckia sp. 28-YEA-48]